MCCTQFLLLVGGGGGVQKALKEPLRPNCEPSEMPPPPSIPGLMKLFQTEFLLGFFNLWNFVMSLVHSNFKICTRFSNTGTQCFKVIIQMSEFYMVFHLWYSVMK